MRRLRRTGRLRAACARAGWLLVALLSSAAAPARAEPPEEPAGSSGVAREHRIAGAARDGLIYVRPDGERTDLWRVRLADGATRPFTHTPGRDEAWPFWSPVVSRLVFEARSTRRRNDGRELLLWDPERDAESQVPAPRAWSQGWAAWSPVNGRLTFAFSSFRGQRPPAGIAVVDVTNGERALYASTTQRRPFFRPEFAPDGARVVAQRHDESRVSQIFLLERDKAPVLLAGGDGFHAQKGRFTRDGRLVVFTYMRVGETRADVALVRPDGTGLRLLGSVPQAHDHTTRASPARDEIAFISDRDGKYDLFLVGVDGGEARNLTRELAFDVNAPRWSPDGERIALVGGRRDEPEAAADAAKPADAETGAAAAKGAAGDAETYVVVVDREGKLLLQTPGYSPDWMPAWP